MHILNHVFMYITQLVIVVSPSTDNDALSHFNFYVIVSNSEFYKQFF